MGMYQVWNPRGELDLHDYSAAASNAILDLTMSEFSDGERPIADLSVITGQGHGSADGPVLVESTRAFLREQFELEITEVPSNPGMFVVKAAAIQAWVDRRGS